MWPFRAFCIVKYRIGLCNRIAAGHGRQPGQDQDQLVQRPGSRLHSQLRPFGIHQQLRPAGCDSHAGRSHETRHQNYRPAAGFRAAFLFIQKT